MIRNYLGFPQGISGMRLAQRARTQAIRFGTRFFTGWPATGLTLGDRRLPTRCTPTGVTCGLARLSSPLGWTISDSVSRPSTTSSAMA